MGNANDQSLVNLMDGLDCTSHIQLASKLHHDSDGGLHFAPTQIGEPNGAWPAASRCGGSETCGTRRRAGLARKVLWQSIIAARRCDTAAAREVRHVGVAIPNLEPPGDVLSRHPL